MMKICCQLETSHSEYKKKFIRLLFVLLSVIQIDRMECPVRKLPYMRLYFFFFTLHFRPSSGLFPVTRLEKRRGEMKETDNETKPENTKHRRKLNVLSYTALQGYNYFTVAKIIIPVTTEWDRRMAHD